MSDCYNCGGDGFSVEGGDCPACLGTGKNPASQKIIKGVGDNELDRLQSLADELAAALRKSEQYIVLALIEGRRDKISPDTLKLAEQDLDGTRAALAKYDEAKS